MAALFTANAFAQDKDTAYVPFSVNVDATATAKLDDAVKSTKALRAGYTDTLHIIVEGGNTPIARQGITPNPVAMHIYRGKISLELSRQFGSTDIALYSLNGKQIMRGKAAASEAVKNISHSDVKTGVYLLSVKGAGGNAFTTRLAHSGGGLNINVAFSNGNPTSLLEKTIPGNWTITVSADGYLDTSYAFVPETGLTNTPVQNIILRPVPDPDLPTVSGTITADNPAGPLAGATVTLKQGEVVKGSATTAANGTYTISNVENGTYTIEVTKDGYYPNTIADVVVNGANVSGQVITLEHGPYIACSVTNPSVYEGTVITQPVLVACSDGSEPSGIVLSGNLPNWDNPAHGTYAVFVKADCGFGTLPAIPCGALRIDEVTLTCGNVPASGNEAVAITPPELTCSHGTVGTPAWSPNAPNWSHPTHGTYSDISVTANCGVATKTADCSGSLTIDEVTLTCERLPEMERFSGFAFYRSPDLRCSHGTLGTPAWSNAPDWNNPAAGTYSDISVTANCGVATKTADCDDSYIVHCSGKDNTSRYYCSNDMMREYGFLTDDRSDPPQTYKTVVIGDLTWMAENLNNGDPKWVAAMDLPATYDGSLYGSDVNHKGICPDGWHIPTKEEFEALLTTVENTSGTNDIGSRLQSVDWCRGNNDGPCFYHKGYDTYGFTALPTTDYSYDDDDGGYSAGRWWSATESTGGGSAWALKIDYYNYQTGANVSTSNKLQWYSVRCVQNPDGAALCDGLPYTSSQFCSGNTIHERCGGTVLFTPGIEACCGNNRYNLSRQFCKNDMIYDKCAGAEYNPATHLCDPRDGKQYKHVTIGTQTWMAENLNYDVPNTTNDVCYDNLTSNCDKYGRLYDWATAMDSPSSCNDRGCYVDIRGNCPEGWLVPSPEDWERLINYVGRNDAGTKLKARSGWNGSGNGTDDYGFSALPGGYYYNSGFQNANNNGYWWTDYDVGDDGFSGRQTYALNMGYNYSNVDIYTSSKWPRHSVRCIKY